jgi:hypothetical protein
LQDKDFLATVERIELRPVPYAEPALPAWRIERPSRPLIYLTFGTAFGTAKVLTTAIQGLTALNAHVVVSTGRVRPEQLGTVPDNVTVQAWVPQADLLPHVDVVVHHGGNGTTCPETVATPRKHRSPRRGPRDRRGDRPDALPGRDRPQPAEMG